MVIDDNNMNLRLAEFALTKGGYNVLKASGGLEGIELLKTNVVDLVLLDVLMPHPDGFETLELIRDNGFNVPVFFVTAQDEEEAYAEGIIGMIKKPFNHSELLEMVGNVLD